MRSFGGLCPVRGRVAAVPADRLLLARKPLYLRLPAGRTWLVMGMTPPAHHTAAVAISLFASTPYRSKAAS